MTPDEIIFNDYCQKHGYGLIAESSSRFLHGYKLDCEENLKNYNGLQILRKPIPHINFNVLNNDGLNAFAALVRENYNIIAVYNGAKLILMDVFYRMFSYKQILPDRGDPKNELYTDPSLRNLYTDAESLGTFGSPDYSDYTLLCPINPIRKLYAQHFTMLALQFLFEHELAHILNGHLNFIFRDFSSGQIELNPRKIHYPTIIYQTLEMDADCTALLRCANNLIDIVDKLHLQPAEVKILFEDREQCLCDLCLAIVMTFRIFGDGFYKPEDRDKDNHAPSKVRQTYILACLIELIEAANPVNIDIDKLKKKLMIVPLECERAYTIITGNDFKREPYKKENLVEHPLMPEMNNCWAQIRKEVLSHAYLKVFHGN